MHTEISYINVEIHNAYLIIIYTFSLLIIYILFSYIIYTNEKITLKFIKEYNE